MADKKTETVKAPVAPRKRPAPAAKPEYATVDDIKNINETMQSMADVIGKLFDKVNAEPAKPQTAEEAKFEKEVKSAAPDTAPVNPAWIEKATEIIGDALDHCEVLYPKHGGTIFTLVIKGEHSNAPEEYIQRHKVDRRSREIGNEGIEGVENWCKLVKANLLRGKN